MTQNKMVLSLTGAAEACASALVVALPADGSVVEALLDGVCALELYRCQRASGAVARSEAAPLTKLTGGVQVRVALPETAEEAALTLEARLRPGWTEAQLYQRLVTLLTRARAEYEARLAREAVALRLLETGQAGEYALAHLGLDMLDTLTPKDAALALAALARLV